MAASLVASRAVPDYTRKLTHSEAFHDGRQHILPVEFGKALGDSADWLFIPVDACESDRRIRIASPIANKNVSLEDHSALCVFHDSSEFIRPALEMLMQQSLVQIELCKLVVELADPANHSDLLQDKNLMTPNSLKMVSRFIERCESFLEAIPFCEQEHIDGG